MEEGTCDRVCWVGAWVQAENADLVLCGIKGAILILGVRLLSLRFAFGRVLVFEWPFLRDY